MPFGALQLCFYELAVLAVAPLLGDGFYAHLLEGGIAGGATAIVTTPIDCSITRLMLVADAGGAPAADADAAPTTSGGADVRGVQNIWEAAAAVWAEQGPVGFTRGWVTRAAQFAPAAMLFFTAYESLRGALDRL